ncbi:unnamed protein product [Hanseniaspora opuntiae]
MSDMENDDINFADLVSNILLTTEAQENENNQSNDESHGNNENDVHEALGIDSNTNDTTNNNYEEWVDMIESENKQNKNKSISEEDDAFLTNAILNSLQSMAIENPSLKEDNNKPSDKKSQTNNIPAHEELLDADRLDYFNANNGDIVTHQEDTGNNEPENDADNMKLVDDILNYILGDDDKKGSKKKKIKSKKSKAADSSKDSKSTKHKKESKKKKKQASAEDDLQALINQVVSSTLEEHAKQAKKPKTKKKSPSIEAPPLALNTQGGFTSTLQFPEITAPSVPKEPTPKKAKSPKLPKPPKQPVVEPEIKPQTEQEPIYIPADPKAKKKSEKKKEKKEALRKKKNDELDLAQIMKDAMPRKKEKAKLAAKVAALEKAQAKAIAKSKKKELLKIKSENKIKPPKKVPATTDSAKAPPAKEKKIESNKIKVTNVFKNSTIMKNSDGPALITSKTSSNAIIDKSKLAPKKVTTKDRPFLKSDIEMLKVFVKPAVESKAALERKRKKEAKALKKLKKEAKLKEEKARQKKLKEEEKQKKLQELERKKQERLALKSQQRETREQELALKNLEKENNKKMQEAQQRIMFERQKPAPTKASIKNGFKRLSIKNYKPSSKGGLSFILADGKTFLNTKYTAMKPDITLSNAAMIKAGIWEKYQQARNDLVAELKEKGEDRPLKKKEEAKILKQVKKAHAKEVQDMKRQVTKEKKRLEKEGNRMLRERETARRMEYMKSLDVKDLKEDVTVDDQNSSEASQSAEIVIQKDKHASPLPYNPVDPSKLVGKSAVISKNSLRLIPVVLKGPPFPYYLRLDDMGIPTLPLAKNNEKSSLKRMDDFEVKGKVDVYGRNLTVWDRFKAENPDTHMQKYNAMIKSVQASLLKYLGSLTSFDMELGSFEKGYYINWSVQHEAHPPFVIPEVPVFTYGESIVKTANHETTTGLSADVLRLRNFNKELIQQRIDRKPVDEKNESLYQKSKFKNDDAKPAFYYSSANKNTFINVTSGPEQSHLGTVLKHFDSSSVFKRKRDDNQPDTSQIKIIQLKEGKPSKRSKSHSSKSSKIKKLKRFQVPSSSVSKIPRHPDTLFDNINQKLFCILKTLDKAPSGYVKSYEEVAMRKDPLFKPIELKVSDDLQSKIDNEINLLIRRFRKYYSRIDNETIQSYSTIIRSYTIFYLVWYTGLITDIGHHFGKIVKNYTKLFNVDKVVLGIRDILRDMDKRNLRKKPSSERTTTNGADLTEIFDFILARVEIKLKMEFFMPFISHRNETAMAPTIDATGNLITRDDTNKKRVNKYLLLSILFAIMEDCIQFVLSGLPEKVRAVIEDSNLEVHDAVSVISREMAGFVSSNVKAKKRMHLETSNDETILPPNQRFVDGGYNQLENNQGKETDEADKSNAIQTVNEPIAIDKFKPGYDFGFGKVNERTYEQHTDINPLVKSKIDVVWEMFFKYTFNLPSRKRLLRNRVMSKRIQLKVSTDVYKKFEQEYKTERMRRYRALKAEQEMDEIKDIKSYIAKSPLKSQWITKSQMDKVRSMKGMNGKLTDNDLLNMLAFIQGNNLTLIKDIIDDMEKDCFDPAKKIKKEVNDDKKKTAEVIDFTKDRDNSAKVDENVVAEIVEIMDETNELPVSETKEGEVQDASKNPETEDDPTVDPSLK